jgi:hypothetical protein
MMNRPFLAAVAGAAALASVAHPEAARAECLDFGFPPDVAYECFDDDTNGVSDPTDEASVTVFGATVSSDTPPTISLSGDDTIVENFGGTVSSSDGTAIETGDRGNIFNGGVISGDGGYGVVAGPGSVVTNHGSIGGLLGSVLFGDGDDSLDMSNFATISGDAEFGGGNDTVSFIGVQAPEPGLRMSVFRGGAHSGYDPDNGDYGDLVSFNGLDIDALLAMSLLSSHGDNRIVLRVATEAGAPDSVIYFAEFETFMFDGVDYSMEQLAALGRPQVIPVPAALPLLASALGLVGLLGRRRSRG